VQIPARLALAHSLRPGHVAEFLAFEVELEQRPIASPGGRIESDGVGRTKLLHRVEQGLFERRTSIGRGHVRHEQRGQRMDLEQRWVVQLSQGVLRVREQGRPVHLDHVTRE
jgi:hypothetical protein